MPRFSACPQPYLAPHSSNLWLWGNCKGARPALKHHVQGKPCSNLRNSLHNIQPYQVSSAWRLSLSYTVYCIWLIFIIWTNKKAGDRRGRTVWCGRNEALLIFQLLSLRESRCFWFWHRFHTKPKTPSWGNPFILTRTGWDVNQSFLMALENLYHCTHHHECRPNRWNKLGIKNDKWLLAYRESSHPSALVAGCVTYWSVKSYQCLNLVI